MKPYYQDDSVTLYHGDARDIAPSLTADALVADPPYGISATTANHSRGRSRMTLAHDWPEVHGDREPFDPAPWLAYRQVVLWGANHYAGLPASPSWLVWDKRVGLGSNDSADCELAWSNLGGPARLFQHRWSGMLRDSERGESYHPTQKPVALMRWVLDMTEGTILDPFAGSGPTLRAAKDLGRTAIGIEIEERYCEIAARRLSQEVLALA